MVWYVGEPLLQGPHKTEKVKFFFIDILSYTDIHIDPYGRKWTWWWVYRHALASTNELGFLFLSFNLSFPFCFFSFEVSRMRSSSAGVLTSFHRTFHRTFHVLFLEREIWVTMRICHIEGLKASLWVRVGFSNDVWFDHGACACLFSLVEIKLIFMFQYACYSGVYSLVLLYELDRSTLKVGIPDRISATNPSASFTPKSSQKRVVTNPRSHPHEIMFSIMLHILEE